MLISEIFDVTSGQVMSRITAEFDEVEIRKVLLPKAINDGNVLKDELVDNKMKIQLDASKMTMEGDIVIKLSTPYGGCLINSENVGLVVPSFCTILRKKNHNFDTKYLIAYINSKPFADQVLSKVTGNSIGILSVGQLKSIDVPELSLDKQVVIGNEFMKMAKNKELLEKLIELQHEKIETMIMGGGNND